MTMVTAMDTPVSKSRFKAHALELFRQVEQTGKPIIITDRGIPVLRLKQRPPKIKTSTWFPRPSSGPFTGLLRQIQIHS